MKHSFSTDHNEWVLALPLFYSSDFIHLIRAPAMQTGATMNGPHSFWRKANSSYILKTITYLVNTVEWQPLQIDPLYMGNACRYADLEEISRKETENIYSNRLWVQSIQKCTRFRCLSVSLCSKYHFLSFETKKSMKRRGRCSRNTFFYSNRVEWSVWVFSILFSPLSAGIPCVLFIQPSKHKSFNEPFSV